MNKETADPSANLLHDMAKAAVPGSPEHRALMLGSRCIRAQFRPNVPLPQRDPDWYWLEPGWEPRPGDPGYLSIVSAAVLKCCVTGRVLSGMGGPGPAIHPSVIGIEKRDEL